MLDPLVFFFFFDPSLWVDTVLFLEAWLSCEVALDLEAALLLLLLLLLEEELLLEPWPRADKLSVRERF